MVDGAEATLVGVGVPDRKISRSPQPTQAAPAQELIGEMHSGFSFWDCSATVQWIQAGLYLQDLPNTSE